MAIGQMFQPKSLAYGAGALYNYLTPNTPAMVYKSNYKYRTRSRGYSLTKKTKKIPKKSFKTMVMSIEPGKHNTFNTSLAACLPTQTYSFIPTQNILIGNDNQSRRGDQIYLCALKLSGSFFTNVTAACYKYRMIVGWTGEEYTASGIANTWSSGGVTSGEIFLPNTDTASKMNGIINPKAFTVLYDQTWDINSMIAAASENQSYAFTVPINQTFNYQATAATMGKLKNLYVVIVGNVFGGTGGITQIGATFMATDLIFKE